MDYLSFNGVNGATGGYLVPPMSVGDLGRIALGQEWGAKHFLDLQLQMQKQKEAAFELRAGLDVQDLSEAGWGVIFPAEAAPEVVDRLREALQPLLTLRQGQAGVFYREFSGADGYRQKDSKDKFCSRFGAGPGDVDPKAIPYYLLIVGDPQSIPFLFQYELDVQYAVGRIHFDTLDQYAQYAQSVVTAETAGQVSLPRQAAFFSVANEGDLATNYSAEMLVQPLTAYVEAEKSRFGWEAQLIGPEEATKKRLERLLGGDQTPALLFTASHGLGFPFAHKMQLPFQGALLCQDWPGPGPTHQEISRDHYLGGEDIASDANLLGMVSFHFACFGAGTPYWDNFSARAFSTRSALAPHAFLGALPKRLLGHPRGGALAVIGHIDRAWTYSFKWEDAGAQTVTFESVLFRLLNGETVGSALDHMNGRYADIATMLSNELEESKYAEPDLFKLANLWTANNDARGYAILGDPAVRIPVAPLGEESLERPVLEAQPGREEQIPPVLVRAADPDRPIEPIPQRPTAPPPDVPYGISQPQTILDGLAALSRYAETDAEAFWPGEEKINIKEILNALTTAVNNLTTKLAGFAEEVTSLEVKTYVTENMDSVKYENKRFSGAVQRAVTHISLDGDTDVCIPQVASELDESLWEIHNAMVDQALANRTAMIKAAAEVLANLLGVSKG